MIVEINSKRYIHCSTILYGTVPYRAVRYSAVYEYDTGTVPCGAVTNMLQNMLVSVQQLRFAHCHLGI